MKNQNYEITYTHLTFSIFVDEPSLVTKPSELLDFLKWTLKDELMEAYNNMLNAHVDYHGYDEQTGTIGILVRDSHGVKFDFVDGTVTFPREGENVATVSLNISPWVPLTEVISASIKRSEGTDSRAAQSIGEKLYSRLAALEHEQSFRAASGEKFSFRISNVQSSQVHIKKMQTATRSCTTARRVFPAAP